MTKLIFVVEGERKHVIEEVIDDAVEAGRLQDGDVHVEWTWALGPTARDERED